jgi:hypothetical protein
MIRIRSSQGINKLDALKRTIGFSEITTVVMDLAADFWAQARNMGRPTATDAALDGDMILVAQASLIAGQGHNVIVATTNVKHLSLFVVARLWRDIT